MVRRWIGWWFPDLRRLDESARLRVWHSSYSRVWQRPAYLAFAVVLQVAGQIFINVPVSRLARAHGHQGPLVSYALPVVVALLMAFVILWFVRRAITLHIRQAINAEGLPVCLHCGYNLTGSPSPRCPECGNTIARATHETQQPGP